MGSKTSSHSSGSRSSHGHHRRHHKSSAKLLLFLHSFNLLFALLSIGLFVAIIPIWNANFFHKSGLLRGDWIDSLPILPLLITFLTSACYIIKLAHARWSETKPVDYLKSRHASLTTLNTSKTPLILTLFTLILLLAFLTLSATSGLYRFWRPDIITTSIKLSSGTASSSTTLSTLSLRYVIQSVSGTDPASPGLTPPKSNPSAHNSKVTFDSCTLANVFTQKCTPTLFLLGDLQITAISTSSFAWLLNLTILALQLRDRQYQKRKLQRSLRAKARSKLDLIEDEMSRAEKGIASSAKKIHHEKRRNQVRSPSVPRSAPYGEIPRVTRPVRARTLSNAKEDIGDGLVRPKQHYYDPNITASRLRSPRDPIGGSAITVERVLPLFTNSASGRTKQFEGSIVQEQGRTAYSRAVDEARRKVKPTETMRDWLAARS